MNKPRFVSPKKAIAIALTAIMPISMTACQKSNSSSSDASSAVTTAAAVEEAAYLNKTGYPICDEPITITVSGDMGPTPDWNATYQVQEIEKQLGIKLACTPYAHDAWTTQFTLMLTTDALPDLIINGALASADVAKYGTEGYFIALNDYLDYAPNLAATFKENPAYETYLTASDENIYGLSNLNKNTLGKVPRVFMNANWLKNVGMSVPTTIDELYNVLTAFKAKDANGNGDAADEIPFGYIPTSYFQGATGILSGFGIQTTNSSYILTADDKGTVSLAETSENYKAYLKFMNKLYKEGLMSEETFVQTTDEFKEKFAADRIGFYGTGSAPFVEAGKPIDYDANFTTVMGLTSEYNSEKLVPMANPVGATIGAVVSAKTEYPEAVVRLLDYFYDAEKGSIASSRGFEGVTFEYTEVEGLPGSKIATMNQPDGYASQEEFRYKKAVINNGFNLLSGVAGTQYGLIMDATDDNLDNILLKKYGWAVLVEKGLRQDGIKTTDVFPGLVYTEKESDIRSTLYTDINNYLQTANAQFITGEVDVDAGWDAFLSTLDQMGLKNQLEIEQAAYDRLKK